MSGSGTAATAAQGAQVTGVQTAASPGDNVKVHLMFKGFRPQQDSYLIYLHWTVARCCRAGVPSVLLVRSDIHRTTTANRPSGTEGNAQGVAVTRDAPPHLTTTFTTAALESQGWCITAHSEVNPAVRAIVKVKWRYSEIAKALRRDARSPTGQVPLWPSDDEFPPVYFEPRVLDHGMAANWQLIPVEQV